MESLLAQCVKVVSQPYHGLNGPSPSTFVSLSLSLSAFVLSVSTFRVLSLSPRSVC